MVLALLTAVALSFAPDATIEGIVAEDTLKPAAAAVYNAKEGDTLHIRINSPGGDGFAMLDFLSAMKVAKDRKHLTVECHVDWLAASAAAIIFESPFCDKRTASRASVFLFHGVSAGGGGKAGEVEDVAKLMRILDRAVAELIAPRLHMTPDGYLEWVERRDRFLSYDELAAVYGLDEVEPTKLAVEPATVSPLIPPALAPQPCAPPAVEDPVAFRVIKAVRAWLAHLQDLVSQAWAYRTRAAMVLVPLAAGLLIGWHLVPSIRRRTALPHRRRAARGAGSRRSRR